MSRVFVNLRRGDGVRETPSARLRDSETPSTRRCGKRDTIDAATETRRPDADFCHMVSPAHASDLEEPLSPKEPQEEAIPRGANH